MRGVAERPAPQSRVSVLIVSYNNRAVLGRCLAPLVANDGLEVILHDNASTDGSADLVAERFPSVRVLTSPDNVGFARGVNAAARHAVGEYLLLLNPDTEPPSALAEEMVAALEESGAAAVGVRQVDSAGFYQLACGPGPSLWADLLRKIVQLRLDRRDQRIADWLQRLLREARDVPWVAGSCLMVRRDAFRAVGGFDDDFFLYFEDIDFCLRLRAAGMRVRYDPRVTLVHHRGVSAASNRAVAQRAYRDSQLRFWSKHRGRAAHWLVARYLWLRRALGS